MLLVSSSPVRPLSASTPQPRSLPSVSGSPPDTRSFLSLLLIIITLMDRLDCLEAGLRSEDCCFCVFGKCWVFWNDLQCGTVEQNEKTKRYWLEERRRERHDQRHHWPRKRYGERQCLSDTGRRSDRKSSSARASAKGRQPGCESDPKEGDPTITCLRAGTLSVRQIERQGEH